MRLVPPITINTAMLNTTVTEPTVAEVVWVSAAAITAGNRRIRTQTGRAYKALTTHSGITTPPESDPARWEDDGPIEHIWIASASYTIGDRRIRPAIHRTFKAKTTHTGVTTAPEDDTTNWEDDGPTNAWAMFDYERNTPTTRAGPFTVTITPNQRFDSLVLSGMTAGVVTATVQVAAATVWTETISLTQRATTRWSQYFFGKFRYSSALARFNLPPFTAATIILTFTPAVAGTVVGCGAAMIGLNEFIGRVNYGSSSDALNFSKITRNEATGVTTIIPARNIPKMSLKLSGDSELSERLYVLRDEMNGKVAAWCGIDADDTQQYFAMFLIVGVYRKFVIDAARNEELKVSLDIEEV